MFKNTEIINGSKFILITEMFPSSIIALAEAKTHLTDIACFVKLIETGNVRNLNFPLYSHS